MDSYKIPITLSSGDVLMAEADLYKADPAKISYKNTAVIYFHGGGLLFGSRKDLPELYRDMFLNAGYDFLAFDYPLAPEHSISQITDSCCQLLRWFFSNYQEILSLESSRYILFGRSAGAYLALQTAFYTVCQKEEILSPCALLLFYGYPGFSEEEFFKENRYYQAKFPPISRETAFQAAKQRPDFDTEKSPRVLLYVYARQTGRWVDLVGTEDELEQHSLSPQQLSSLPPAFLTASSMDHDVPFRLSKSMARQIPGSKFYPVYNLEHDFDQDTSVPEGKAAYEECLRWLNCCAGE